MNSKIKMSFPTLTRNLIAQFGDRAREVFCDTLVGYALHGIEPQNLVGSFVHTFLAHEDLGENPSILGDMLAAYASSMRAGMAQRHHTVTADTITNLTQIFTPNWIARYLAENTLAPLVGEKRIASLGWDYVIPLARPFPRYGDNLEAIRILDPCAGTGHILLAYFDCLLALYRQEGYADLEAVRCILGKNLYGLDLDPYAVKLCRTVLFCRARGVLKEHTVRSIEELPMEIHGIGGEQGKDTELIGSLYRPRIPTSRAETLLCEQYDICVTNPPYLGKSSLSDTMRHYLVKQYPSAKTDLYTAFILRCTELTKPTGYFGLVTSHSWGYLSSYRQLRESLLSEHTLLQFLHLGGKCFEAVGTVIQACAFIGSSALYEWYPTEYRNLTEAKDKPKAFFDPSLRYRVCQEQFKHIPNHSLCYWASEPLIASFSAPPLASICKPFQGMTTSNNARFLRHWYEVKREDIGFGCGSLDECIASKKQYFPYCKGTGNRWYGGQTQVIDFAENGRTMREFHKTINRNHAGGRIKNIQHFFQESLSWSFISSDFSVRAIPYGYFFDVSGSTLVPPEELRLYLLGFLNSTVARDLFRVLNPTINFQVENVAAMPIILDQKRRPQIEKLVKELCVFAKEAWDENELSWDFHVHPVCQYQAHSLEEGYQLWCETITKRNRTITQHENALDSLFAEIYGWTPVPRENQSCEEDPSLFSVVSFLLGRILGRYGKRQCRFLSFFGGDYQHAFVTALSAFFPDPKADWAWLLSQIGEEALQRDFFVWHVKQYRRKPLYWLVGKKPDWGYILATDLDHSLLEELCQYYQTRIYEGDKTALLLSARLERLLIDNTRYESSAGISESWKKFEGILGIPNLKKT